VGANPSTYLPNYVDISKYGPNVDEKGYVLYFGRISEEKGVTVLLDAAKRIPKILFVLVGTGPL
jgi:glycosyltransferase involved in cell wall biosynthesis